MDPNYRMNNLQVSITGDFLLDIPVALHGHFDLAPYANVNNWFQKMKKEIPNYEKANKAGADIFGIMYKTGMHPGNKLKLKEVFG